MRKLANHIKGVILSGSPFSVRDDNSPALIVVCNQGRFPLAGVCYGAQYLSWLTGGVIAPFENKEYGRCKPFIYDHKNELVGV